MVATPSQPVVHRRDGHPQVLIRCTACPACSGRGLVLQPTYAADGSRHALAGTLDGRPALEIGVFAACALVSLVSAGAARAGPHMIWGNTLRRRGGGAPSRRRRRLAGQSPSLSACRSQSAPPAGTASSHRAPSVRFRRRPRRPRHASSAATSPWPDSELSLRARDASQASGARCAEIEQACAPPAPGLGAPVRSKRDAPGRPSASRPGRPRG